MASPFINPWLPKTEKKPMGPTMDTSHPIPVITPSKIKASGMSKSVTPPKLLENPWMSTLPKPVAKPSVPQPRYIQKGDAIVDTKTGKTIGYKREAEKASMQEGNDRMKGNVKKGLQMFVGDTVRAAVKAVSRPRTLTSFLTGNTGAGIYNAVTEKPREINIKPESRTAKAVFGEEPITGLGGGLTGRVSEIAGKVAEKYGLPKGVAESGSQAAMLPFMLLAADPRMGPGKKVVQEGAEKLIKEATEKFGKEAIEKLLKEGGEEAVVKLAQANIVELPKALKGAAPKFGFGSKLLDLNFGSDVDKALYIVAQKTPSKADSSYLDFLKKIFTDKTEPEIRALGQDLKNTIIKPAAKDAKESVVQVAPDAYRTLTKPAEVVKPLPEVPPMIDKLYKYVHSGEDIGDDTIKELSVYPIKEKSVVYQGVRKGETPGVSWTKDKEVARAFAGKNGKVIEKIVDPAQETTVDLARLAEERGIKDPMLFKEQEVLIPKKFTITTKAQEAIPNTAPTPPVDVPALPKVANATDVPPPVVPDASAPLAASPNSIEKFIGEASEVVSDWGRSADPVGKWADNINLDKLNTPDDVKLFIKNVAASVPEVVDKSKRGVQKVATTKKLAEQLGMTWVDAVARPIGKGHSAEELEAYHTLMLNQAERLKKVEDSIIENPTDEAMVKYVEELNRYTMLQSSVHGARAETGRALNILKYMKSAAKDAPAKLQEDVIKKFGGQKMTKEIASHLISARKLAEETGSYQGYFDLIRRTQNPKFSDYAYEYWINSILSNPKTHIVNMLSNAGQALKQVAERGVQAAIELPRGKNREVTFSEVGHMVIGMLDGFNDGVTRFLQVWKNGVTPEQIMKLDSNKLPIIGGKTGRIIRTPTTLLAAADEFFKAISSRSELYAQASRVARKEGLKGKAAIKRMAEIIANPTDEILLATKNHALEATFQQELGRISGALLKARNLLPGARYIIPFVRTPTNIFKEAVKSSPLGFINTAYKAYAGAPTEEITKSASKALLGTAVSVPIVMGFLNGRMTGSVPNDPAERDKFYRDGKKPMSVRIGNTWVSLSRMEPFATVVGMVGNVMENIKKGEKVTSQVADVVNAFSSQIEDKTFLQGISDLIQLATGRADEKSYLLKKLVIGTAAGFEPQLIAQIARSMDTTYRDVKDDSWLNQFVKTIKSRTPWLSQSVPSLLDAFGQEAKRTGGFIENMINPLERGKITQDPVELELTRINTDITKPTRTKQVGGISGKLDVDAYRKYLKATGQVGHAMLVKMFALPEYQSLPQDDQVKAVETIMSQTRKGISELRAGELLLSLAGIRDVKNPAVIDDMNLLYSQVIKTEEWKDMDDEEKLKLLLDNYATLSLRHSNDQGGGKQ